ncbi:hypothetical protein V8E53_002827 [Lactarius tabidus]
MVLHCLRDDSTLTTRKAAPATHWHALPALVFFHISHKLHNSYRHRTRSRPLIWVSQGHHCLPLSSHRLVFWPVPVAATSRSRPQLFDRPAVLDCWVQLYPDAFLPGPALWEGISQAYYQAYSPTSKLLAGSIQRWATSMTDMTVAHQAKATHGSLQAQAHHYWCQTSASCFRSKRAAGPFRSVLALGVGLICMINPNLFYSNFTCSRIARHTQWACTFRML